MLAAAATLGLNVVSVVVGPLPVDPDGCGFDSRSDESPDDSEEEAAGPDAAEAAGPFCRDLMRLSKRVSASAEEPERNDTSLLFILHKAMAQSSPDMTLALALLALPVGDATGSCAAA